MQIDHTDIQAWANAYARQSPQEILKFALDRFANLAISFSGAEDVVLVDMAVKIRKGVKVFSIDTGRLHKETYQFIEQVRTHYPIQLEIIFPEAGQVEKLVREKGLFSFYEDGHQECCGIRKVSPLRRRMAALDAWITGQRRDQSPDTRSILPVIQLDGAFTTDEHPVVKLNPLANWHSDQVWEYIRTNHVPYNPLHDQGYKSIGCAPCTRAIQPNEHERAGRWWWEAAREKECGLHVENKIPPSTSTSSGMQSDMSHRDEA